MQQTMREVIRAIASLSGVELPGLPPGLQDDAAPPPRLDIRNLKDRFRNDLEGFSIKTTEELTKRAREQTHAALDAVQNEVRGSMDQVAAEFREKLQLPSQIEKLVEPCVAEAVTRLEESLSRKVEQFVAEHEQLVRDRLQGLESSVQAQISTLEQTVHQVRDLNAGSAAQLSAEQPGAAELAGRIDQVAAEFREKLQDNAQIEKMVEPRVAEAVTRLEGSLSRKVEQFVAEHEQLVQDRLQETLRSVQGQISTLEQTVQQVHELKADSIAHLSTEQPSVPANFEHLLAEHERLVREKLQGMESSVRLQISALEQTVQQVRELKSDSIAHLSAKQPSVAEVVGRIDQIAAEVREKLPDHVQIEKLLEPRVAEAVTRLEGSLSQRVEHLVAEHEHLVQDRLQGTLSSVQGQISTLEQAVQQIRELKSESVAQLSAQQPGAADNAAGEPETNPNKEFNGFIDQAFSRIESSFSNLLETSRMQPSPSAGSGLKDLRNAIPFNEMERERRVQQALDDLGRLGTKNPPAS